MTAILELGPQLQKIVDLPVKNDSDIARFVKDRLATAGEIDNAQPANAKNNSRLREHAPVVRTSMGERLHHVANAPFGRLRVRANYTANAAHRIFSYRVHRVLSGRASAPQYVGVKRFRFSQRLLPTQPASDFPATQLQTLA